MCGGFVDGSGVGGTNAYSSAFGGFNNMLLLFLRHFDRLRDSGFAYFSDGENLFYYKALRDDGLEFVVDEIDGVDFFVAVAIDDTRRYFGNPFVFQFRQHANVFAHNRGTR